MNPNNYTQQPMNQFSYSTTPPQNLSPIKKPSKLKDNLGTLFIIVSAPLLAVLLSIFVFRTYQVDGPSMLTTLHDKDRLIINKVPATWSKITRSDYIPARYDVVVFSHKGSVGSSGSGSAEKQIIKRVIALPGERVVINSGTVRVFNKDNPNGFLVDQQGPHAKIINKTSGNIDETVKDGEVFVLGDNRGNSLDSRELGTVRSQDIIGKLVLRIYPFKDWRSF